MFIEIFGSSTRFILYGYRIYWLKSFPGGLTENVHVILFWNSLSYLTGELYKSNILITPEVCIHCQMLKDVRKEEVNDLMYSRVSV